MSRPSMTRSLRFARATEMIDENLAQPWDAADERDVFVHAIFTQEWFGIDAVDQDE